MTGETKHESSHKANKGLLTEKGRRAKQEITWWPYAAPPKRQSIEVSQYINGPYFKSLIVDSNVPLLKKNMIWEMADG